MLCQLSARGETPRTPPLNHPFNLVVGNVNRVLMFTAMKTKKPPFWLIRYSTILERFPTATFALTRTTAQYTSVLFNSVTYLPGKWTAFR